MISEDEIKNYNGILARVYIENENGNEVGYIYELEIIKELVIKRNKANYETLLNIGDIFRFSDIDYEVTKIYTRFLNETDVNFMKYGINMYGIGELLPFNFQITYVVKEAYSDRL